ncbi:MAG: DUF4292 domain-containing protein [Sinomicrobium sp.]|nr:DUF4292 domain-containing protein [Sinomicrobium sp.]
MKAIVTYRRNTIFMTAALLLTACGSKKVVAEGEAVAGLSVKNIIKNHYKNQLDFKTIRGRMKIDYDDGYTSKSVNMSLRMEKGKAIWLSATLNMAKVLITPERVSFYNKLDNTYFDGDFSYLSALLGTELNFEKVQNMLLGQALFNLETERYETAVVNNNYQLKPVKDIALFKKLFLIDPVHFKMASQQLSQPEKERMLQISYTNYRKIDNRIVPDEIQIIAEEGKRKTTILLEYKNIEFNQNVSFPYRIPDGYTKIKAE